jgi:putative peptidoglycan lipid II flippase
MSDLSPRFVYPIVWDEIRPVLKVSIPRALTLSLHQFVLLGMVGFASIMSVGSVSVFQFAFNLQSVPLAIIGVSYSVAAFPLLAQLFAEGNKEGFRQHMTTALRHIIFWSVPVLMLIVVVRAQFVRVILGSGEFNWDDTRLTAAVLALFLFSLASQAIHLIVVRALYAVGNTRLPFYVTLYSSIGALVCSVGLYALFVSSSAFQLGLEALLRIKGVPGSEIMVLPLGYTIALIAHSIALIALSKRHLFFSVSDLGTHALHACFAGLFGALCAYGTLNFLVDGLRTDTLMGIFLQGFIAGSAGLVGVVLGYHAQGSPELKEAYMAFHKRIFKTEIIAPQDEDHLAV